VTVISDDILYIRQPGRYHLAANRSRPLHIAANDISLNLRGFMIDGGLNAGSTDSGIYIRHGCSGVAIKNGIIKGFMYGILADDGFGEPRSSRILISRIRCVGSTLRGIMLYSTHSRVKDCIVGWVGGSNIHPDAYAIGIEVRGNYSTVTGNSIFEVYGRGVGESVGISISDENLGVCRVERNTIMNTHLPDSARSFGVWCRSGAMISRNTMINFTYGIGPANSRTRHNTVDNIFVGEQCTNGFFSIKDRDTNTIYIPMEQPECSDCIDKAKQNIDILDPVSLVRLASLLYEANSSNEALFYYKQAALLGNDEAMRWVKKLGSR
jgi:hypothetical protein